MALNNYITQVQRLIHDPNSTYYNTTDLTAFVNLARAAIANKSKSLRLLLPPNAGIASITVGAGGSGYVGTPTVVITGTGTGATAHATVAGNAVTGVVVDTPGTGYDTSTVITFTGGGGSGATATATVNCWNTVLNQELYQFAATTPLVALEPGYKQMVGLESVAVSWGSLKPLLKHWVWSDFQAYLRSNNTGLASWPTVWSQYRFGIAGSIYVYPKPSQIMQWDWDTWCIPSDLASDSDFEALSYPWTDIIQYYAAYLAYSNSQRPQDAGRMLEIYKMQMSEAGAQTQGEFVPDPYEVNM